VDVATIIGFVGGTGIMFWMMHHEGGLNLFFNVPGLILVVGGMIAACFFSFPMAAMKALPGSIKKCFSYPLPAPGEIINRIADYSVIARRDGLLGLEEKIKQVKDPFLAKGIALVVDGFAAENVRSILEIDVEKMRERHTQAKKVIEGMSAYAPGFGMVGTLLGLVGMLAKLSDPSTIGGSMAVSLLATFYGAAIANIYAMPLASKLDARTKEECLLRHMMIEGIIALQTGEKPQVIRERLRAFLSPTIRKSVEAPAPAAAAPAAKG
jgi:chemotaxis protein MotA